MPAQQTLRLSAVLAAIDARLKAMEEVFEDVFAELDSIKVLLAADACHI